MRDKDDRRHSQSRSRSKSRTRSRRRSRSRTPPRNKRRDRSGSRSHSPPSRRDRRGRSDSRGRRSRGRRSRSSSRRSSPRYDNRPRARRSFTPSPRRGSPGGARRGGWGGGGQRDSGGLPELNQVYKGEVKKMESFGCFVSIGSFRRNGLLHISQLSKNRVERVEDVVSLGDQIWVKVVKLEEDPSGKGTKIALSMKTIDQRTGDDSDPDNLAYAEDQQRRGGGGGGGRGGYSQRGKIEIGAVVKTKCTKCGGDGHFAYECFNSGKKYDIIADDDDGDRAPRGMGGISRGGGVGFGERSMGGRGRGRDATLPAWMTKEGIKDPPSSGPSLSDYRDPGTRGRSPPPSSSTRAMPSGGRGRGLELTKPAWMVAEEKAKAAGAGGGAGNGEANGGASSNMRKRSRDRDDGWSNDEDDERKSKRKHKEKKHHKEKKEKKEKKMKKEKRYGRSRSRSRSRSTSLPSLDRFRSASEARAVLDAYKRNRSR